MRYLFKLHIWKLEERMETQKLGDHPNPLQERIRRKENKNRKKGRPTLHRKSSLHALTVRRMGMMMSTIGFYIRS